MYKLTIFFAILAVAKAGFLHGNNHGAVIEESFAAPLAQAPLSLPAIPAPIYGPPLRAASPISFAAPAPIAFPAPSYAAPIIKTSSFAAPIGIPAPIYGPPASIFRPSLAVAAPAPIYGAPAALPINSGFNSW